LFDEGLDEEEEEEEEEGVLLTALAGGVE